MKKYLAPRFTWGLSAAALPQVHTQIEKRANLIDTDHPAP